MAGSVLVAVLVSVITGALAGGISSQRTIAALIVHIEYLKSHIERHETAIMRAHQRMDKFENVHTRESP